MDELQVDLGSGAGIFFMGSKVGSCRKTVWLGEQRNDGQQMGLGSLMGSEEGDHYLDSQLASAARTK